MMNRTVYIEMIRLMRNHTLSFVLIEVLLVYERDLVVVMYNRFQ